jgi:hypothetical protein
MVTFHKLGLCPINTSPAIIIRSKSKSFQQVYLSSLDWEKKEKEQVANSAYDRLKGKISMTMDNLENEFRNMTLE